MSDSSDGVVNISISVDQSEIDAAIANIDASTTGKGVSTGTARTRQPKFVSKYAPLPDEKWEDKDMLRMAARMQEQTQEIGYEIKGLETAVHRVARMIPGVREIDRIYKNINRAQSGYAIMAGINFALIAARIIRMINQYFDQKKRQEQELEAAVREIRGLTSHSGYSQYQYQQRAAVNSYRNINR
jgi:hypothetical protein